MLDTTTVSHVLTHPLRPLLAPRSVALVGASVRPGSVGNQMVKALLKGGYEGAVFPVNPRYREIEGLTAYGALDELPTAPDLVVLSLASARLEAAMDAALAAGAKAAVIFDPCQIAGETNTPKLLDRLRAKARESALPVCGGNGMGFFNFDAKCHISFDPPPDRAPGAITHIAHSGSAFLLPYGRSRHGFNLAVSAGQEIGATVDRYMDYALEQPTTRVITLFVEAVRDPEGFAAALAKARERHVPVVVCKVGRTAESARLALTHTGALVGDDAAFGALLEHHGAVRADTLDQLLATAHLLSQGRAPAAPGFAAVTDSGGFRELLIDRAAALQVPLADFTEGTKDALRAVLPHNLEATNPLDAAGPVDETYGPTFRKCHDIVSRDSNVGVLGIEFYHDDENGARDGHLEGTLAAYRTSRKPVFVYTNLTDLPNEALTEILDRQGIPVINGVDLALRAVSALLQRHAHLSRAAPDLPAPPDQEAVARWRDRLADGGTLGERDGLRLLAEFGIPAVEARPAEDEASLGAAAAAIGYPLVLKTAQPGLHHKSDVGGVAAPLADQAALVAAYRDMARRLGPAVLLEPLVARGVELGLGLRSDPAFGPIVSLGAGGTLVELLDDRVHALAPFDRRQARALLERLKLRRLLDGVRGAAPADLSALADAVARFSVLAAALSEVVAEIDVNPLIAGPGGAVAVDALVVAKDRPDDSFPAER